MATFKEAFAAARKAGKKEFTWQGKKYNTKLKEEVSSAPKTSPRPAPNPKRGAFPKVTKDTEDKKTATRPVKAKDWKDKSRQERKAAGEPVSVLGKALKDFKEVMKKGGYSQAHKK